MRRWWLVTSGRSRQAIGQERAGVGDSKMLRGTCRRRRVLKRTTASTIASAATAHKGTAKVDFAGSNPGNHWAAKFAMTFDRPARGGAQSAPRRQSGLIS